MAAKTTQLIVETILPSITPSPTEPTGAGVSQLVVETILAPTDGSAHISQIVVESIIAGSDDGSHGELGESKVPRATYLIGV